MNLLENPIYRADLEKVSKQFSNIAALCNSKILVTGATGLIGSALVDLLLELNKKEELNLQLIIASRNIDKAKNRFGENNTYLIYDAQNANDFSGISADYVICAAGNASPELYTQKPVETINTTVNGVNELLFYSVKNRVKRFLFVSSSEVYGKKEHDGPFKEDEYGYIDVLNSRSSYSMSKRMAETYCRSFADEYGLDCVIVRPGHVFGPTASESDNRISSSFAYKAARGEELIMKSSGMQKRSYCYCLDCAAEILYVMLYGKSGEAYNIGHDEVTTIKGMAQMLADAGEVSLISQEPSKEELQSFNPMDNSSLDNTKVKDLGYRDTFTVEEGLKHTVQILEGKNYTPFNPK